jgi:mitochondrial chaperone BCS1
MFLNFYPGEKMDTSCDFAKSVVSKQKPVSPAMLQGYFMFYKNNPQEAVDNVEKIWTLN